MTDLPFGVSEDAEKAVLGALLMYGDARYAKGVVRRGLKAEHFYWERHAAVYGAAVELAQRDSVVDPITVSAEMRRRDCSMSRDEVENFVAWVPAGGRLSEYAELVRDLAIARDRWAKAQRLVVAIEKRDDVAFAEALKQLQPPRSQQSKAVPHLRLVVDGETGEVVEESRTCPNCQTLQDQIDGLQTELRAGRSRMAKLKRDIEKEAREHALHLPAQALFKHWQQMTGHTATKWSASRFFECEPLLRKYGMELFERAIAGIAYQHYSEPRKNGTIQHHDGWSTLCKSFSRFEEYANRAPRGWTPTLQITTMTEKKADVIPLAKEA